jgi:hypothetical protein
MLVADVQKWLQGQETSFSDRAWEISLFVTVSASASLETVKKKRGKMCTFLIFTYPSFTKKGKGNFLTYPRRSYDRSILAKYEVHQINFKEDLPF